MREGATLVEYRQNLYLYGGYGNFLYNDLWKYDTSKFKWVPLKTNNSQTQGWFGHSAVVYKSSLIIFGGERLYNRSAKLWECFNDFKVFDLDKEELMPYYTFGENLEPLRNHSCFVVSKFLFVFGGLN